MSGLQPPSLPALPCAVFPAVPGKVGERGSQARGAPKQERGTKERSGEGSELGEGETPAGCQKIPAGGSPSVT